jgi:hypothetical protein
MNFDGQRLECDQIIGLPHFQKIFPSSTYGGVAWVLVSAVWQVASLRMEQPSSHFSVSCKVMWMLPVRPRLNPPAASFARRDVFA